MFILGCFGTSKLFINDLQMTYGPRHELDPYFMTCLMAFHQTRQKYLDRLFVYSSTKTPGESF